MSTVCVHQSEIGLWVHFMHSYTADNDSRGKYRVHDPNTSSSLVNIQFVLNKGGGVWQSSRLPVVVLGSMKMV